MSVKKYQPFGMAYGHQSSMPCGMTVITQRLLVGQRSQMLRKSLRFLSVLAVMDVTINQTDRLLQKAAKTLIITKEID